MRRTLHRALTALATSAALALAVPATSAAGPLDLLPLPGAGPGGSPDGQARPQDKRRPEPRKARLDLKLERTRVIVDDEYRSLPAIGRHGQLGVNRTKGAPFFLSHQQHGDLYVRAGIVRGRADLVKRGLEAFDYAFARQRSDGSFGDIQTEEYAFFLQSVAHSLVLLEETRYGDKHRRQLRKYRPRLRRAARQAIAPASFSAFKRRNSSYTHSAYVVGTALAMTALVTGDGKLARRSDTAIRLGLRRQRVDGINPELGGYDVRYQMAGLVYAERLAVYFPGRKLTDKVRKMVNPGLSWMARRIDGDGWIDWRGSTRSCRESNTNGEQKTPGYHFAIRGFAYWGALTGRKQRSKEARRARSYLERRKSSGSLCGPKGKLRPRGDGDGGGGGDGHGGRGGSGAGGDAGPKLPLPVDLFE